MEHFRNDKRNERPVHINVAEPYVVDQNPYMTNNIPGNFFRLFQKYMKFNFNCNCYGQKCSIT